MGGGLSSLKVQRPPVRGVLLDVFETLFSCAGLRTAFIVCGLDPAHITLWLSLILSSGSVLTAAQDYRRFRDVATHTLKALNPGHMGRSEVQAILDVLHHLEPQPDTAAGLALLRAAGVRVLTLTQLDVAASETLFAAAGLCAMVDGFLSVDAVRRWKPAPKAYAYGVAQVGWPSAQVALISAYD